MRAAVADRAGAVRAALLRGLQRLRDRWALLAQIGVAVLVSWFLASEVLGHVQPFFAPVTSIICLGLSYGQRLRRIVEVTAGVAIGVLVGDLTVLVLGSGAWQMALVVVAAMAVGVVLSSGQLVVMQSGVQAVFIVAFAATTGQGLSRWVDAVVGGVVALVIGAVAPSSPVSRPRAQAARTVRVVVAILTRTADAMRRRDAQLAAATLDEARALEGSLRDLRTAADEGVAVARQSPLLRRHRTEAAAGAGLVVPLDRSVRNLRVLVRRTSVALRRDEPLPASYADLVAELATGAADLARVLDEHAVPAAARTALARVAASSARVDPAAGLSAEVVRAQVRSMVVDLLAVAGVDEDEAYRLVPGSHQP